MTFILGMKCSNGMVICADRMETDGYSVRKRPKIESVTVGGEWGVCWSGSGDADPVDKFSYMLKKSLGNDSFKLSSIEKKAEECLRFIKKRHGKFMKVVLAVFGRPLMKPKKGTPYLGHLEQVLYRGNSEDCLLSPEREWCCAGMDTTLTKFLMASTFHSLMELQEAQELGIWVTGMMKEYADGVGGPTDVIFFTPGFDGWLSMKRAKVEKIEKRYSIEDANICLGQYWGDWHLGVWSAKRIAKDVQNYRRKLRRSISRKSKQAR